MRATRLRIGTGIALAIMAARAPAATDAVRAEGEGLYRQVCSLCHNATGPGTNMLARRVGEARAQLEARDDLQADYIRAVVRNGLNGMIALRKVELSDRDLDAITAYLTSQRQ